MNKTKIVVFMILVLKVNWIGLLSITIVSVIILNMLTGYNWMLYCKLLCSGICLLLFFIIALGALLALGITIIPRNQV